MSVCVFRGGAVQTGFGKKKKRTCSADQKKATDNKLFAVILLENLVCVCVQHCAINNSHVNHFCESLTEAACRGF